MIADAYINHDRVVVDCPYGCGNAYKLMKNTSVILCEEPKGGCGQEFQVRVDDKMSDLLAELRKRPAKTNRNWFPENHPLAVRGNMPHGQTVADLAAEFDMMKAEEW